MTGRVVVVVAWIAVVLSALGLHPALRSGSPLGALGREIANDAARGGALLKSFEWTGSGSGVPLAFWLLDLSLLYVAGWGFLRLCPPRVASPTGNPVPLLMFVLAGQVAASFARDATVFYFLSAGIASLSLIWTPRERAAVPESRPSTPRLLVASLLGLLVVVLASPLDSALASLTGAKLLPEAWWPLAVEFGSRTMVAIALSVVLAAACVAVSLARSAWIGLAPACVLVLGSSNPAKGLAVAAVVVLLGQSGSGSFWSAGLLATLTALYAVAAFAVR